MEDLREVGMRAIASVNKLGASDAGDLVLGIGEIIQELREEPELFQNKLDHLEGLFREFAYGEGYELRNNRAEVLEAENSIMPSSLSLGQSFGNNGMWGSGMITVMPISGTFQTRPNSSVAGIPPVLSPPLAALPPKPPRMVPVLEGVPKKKPKKPKKPKEFKKRWWNKQK